MHRLPLVAMTVALAAFPWSSPQAVERMEPLSTPTARERVLIVVIDGLRPDYIRPDWMPTLDALADSGVRGTRHHAVFPSVTRVNGPAIFTGRYPGNNGALGNSVYLPQVDDSRILDAGDVRDLMTIDEVTGGELLTVPSLGEILEANGLTFFASSSGSTGSGALMNHTGAGAGLVHHDITIPDTLGMVVDDVLGPAPVVPEEEPKIPLVARAVDAVLKIGVDRADADVLAVWLTEPDGTAHDFGMGAPETVAALAGVDGEFARLLDGLDARGILESTTVLVTSDHGFSMRTGSEDLDELLVSAGLKASKSSMDVVVAGDAITVREGGEERRAAIVELLQRTPWVGAVFTPSADLPGTASFADAGWAHPRSSDILTSGNWTGGENVWGFQGEVTTPGTAGHGSSSPWDLRAAFVAAGPRIRSGVTLESPTGNIDITPTVLHLIGASRVPEFDGRVLHELIEGDPEAVAESNDSIVTTTQVGGLVYRLTVRHLRVGETWYFAGTRVDRSTVSAADTTAVAMAGGSPSHPGVSSDRTFTEIRRFESPYARQGPAVDATHIYAVTNHAIGKYEKETGELVDEWVGLETGPISHLNSGVVFEGILYAAHSNYPDVPMLSSIEMWDTETMEHVGSHSFGLRPGSATWIDRRDGLWWVAFANYKGRGGAPGRGPAWTHVVTFDPEWREVGGYTFPDEVVDRFLDRSNSGGAFGPDGYLYITGHDAPEIYVLDVPQAGSVFELVEIVPVAAEGQGIAWDTWDPGVLYTIVRADEVIVASRMTGG